MNQRVATATAVATRPHPHDVYAWHVACAGGMVLMLLVPLPPVAAGAMVLAFIGGACWSGARMTGRGPIPLYARLCVCCLSMSVMSVMLLPQLGAATTGATGMQMGGAGAGSAAGVVAVPAGVTALMVLLLVVVAVPTGRRLVAPSTPRRLRAGAGVETVMAAGMAAMLVSMH